MTEPIDGVDLYLKNSATQSVITALKNLGKTDEEIISVLVKDGVYIDRRKDFFSVDERYARSCFSGVSP